MTKNRENYTSAEAERRATEALRRALSTPYKPQRSMVGKTKPTIKKSVKSKSPKSR
jgi:hypothetical protein